MDSGEDNLMEDHEACLMGAPNGSCSSEIDGSSSEDERLKEEHVEVQNCPMSEDVYGFAATSLIRDTRMIVSQQGDQCLRAWRLVASQGFVMLNIAMQAYLLLMTKWYVTAKRVHDIRDLYSKFEDHMYPNHTTRTSHNNSRGVPGYFQPKLIETLDDDVKSDVCRISLAHPLFFIVVILVWTLTCAGEIKETIDMFISLVYATPTIDTMAHSTVGLPKHDLASTHTHARAKFQELRPDMVHKIEALHPNERLVIGLTRACKFYLSFFILLPRLLITLSLLWLGSRWLLATIGFEDILVNAVALEFILLLKDLLYRTVVPNRNKRDVQCTQVIPPGLTEGASYNRFLGSFIIYLGAAAWAYFYTFHLQMVIPHYRWDVREVCRQWIDTEFNA